MKWLIAIVCLCVARVTAQVPADQAYQRLEQRIQQRQAPTTQQSPADQIAVLQAENARLRSIIVDLQLQIDALKGDGAGPATQPVAAYTPAPSYTRTNAPTTQQAGPRGDTPTGQTTATGMPTYVGPRGGVYHYSKNGNKVYEKHK